MQSAPYGVRISASTRPSAYRRLTLVVFGGQQISQHLLERELAEIAAQLRRLKHSLKFIEAAALLENSVVCRVQIAKRLSDLERLLLDGCARFLPDGARLVPTIPIVPLMRLRGLLQRLREGPIHFGGDDIEPLVQRADGREGVFGLPAGFQCANRQHSRHNAYEERGKGDGRRPTGTCGMSTAGLQEITQARMGIRIKTIFPYAPGLSTSSCARGASASGISLPTCGL